MTTTTKEDRIEMALETLGKVYDNMVEAAYQFTKLYQELRATTGESDKDWQSDSGWCLYWAAGLIYMLNYSPEREPDAKAVYQQWVRDIGEREPDAKAVYQQQWEFNQQFDAARHW